MSITEEEAKDEVPPKRWRNRWRVIEAYRSLQTGAHRSAGDEYWGVYVWPSREIAEAKAHEDRTPNDSSEYLGPFPVQEPSP